MHLARWTELLVGCAALLGSAGSAFAADPACSSLPGPVYVGGSTAVQPILKPMGVSLARQMNPTNTLVYVSQGSCVGVNEIVADVTPMGACAQGACASGNAIYWGADGTQLTCVLDGDGMPKHLDVGVSDVFVKTCTGSTPPANISDVGAFAQAMSFVVPKHSNQTAITAEEGYFTFGFGQAGMVTPWNGDPMKFNHIRDGNSGTQNLIAYRIGVVPASKMLGKNEGGSTGVLNGITADDATSPNQSIGILSTAFYDTVRDRITLLAFKGFKQSFAYYPDASSTSFDKKNVRDGHYLLWGYLHMVTQVDNSKAQVRPNAALFSKWMLNEAAGPWTDATHDVDDLIIAGNGIPLCAMNVSITGEGGDFKWSPPAAPCGCFYEKSVPGGATTCTTCENDGQCGGSKKCRHGYCEAN